MASGGNVIGEVCTDAAKVVLGFLRNAYQEGSLCDVSIQTSDGIVNAHRVVMAAYSEKLKTAFTKQSAESGKPTLLDMSDYPRSSLLHILDYLYTGALTLNDSNIAGILITSKHLGTKQVTGACTSYLNLFSLDKALPYYEICVKSKEGTLAQEIWNFICVNFEDLWRTEPFRRANISLVQKLLSEDKLLVTSELHVLDAAVRWVEGDPSTRDCELKTLMECCRFPLMAPEDIVTKVENHPLFDRMPDSRHLLYSALCFHSLNSRNSTMAEKFAAKPRRIPSRAPLPSGSENCLEFDGHQ